MCRSQAPNGDKDLQSFQQAQQATVFSAWTGVRAKVGGELLTMQAGQLQGEAGAAARGGDKQSR